MNHFYRALTLLLCFMVFQPFVEATPSNTQEALSLCADRTASNTDNCRRDVVYGGYLLIENLDSYYTLQNGRFQEFLDGTARFTGRWVNIERNDVKFDFDILLSGRTSTPPNEPKYHSCLDVNPENFYYYTRLLGTARGRDAVAGAELEISNFGPAFQIGNGANVTNSVANFGGSGWLTVRRISQPTTGFDLRIRTNNRGGNGDININLSGDGNECFESQLAISCPNNFTVSAEPGANGTIVDWEIPAATTTCMVGNGSNCGTNNIDGFVFMGEQNGSRYFCSEDQYTWLQARELALAAGGHLAVVCNSAENEFIRQGMSNVANPADYAWIGFSDYLTEGEFIWVNGDEDCNYTNWNDGEPNNSGDGEDFARILRSSGKWTDRDADFRAEFILEIPCQDVLEEGGITITQIEGPAPGSVLPIGMTNITYRAVDQCGNSETCSFKITVEETVPVGEITFDCNDDITEIVAPGANGTVVDWNIPTATTTCTIRNGNDCPSGRIDGFRFLGSQNGSSYYTSDDQYTWARARDLAVAEGGHLAVICNAAENEFIRQSLSDLSHPADFVWIGFTDEVREGDFRWITGENCTYTNWNAGEPNNSGGDEHFARLLRSSGKWTDRDADFRAAFILEIPCNDNIEESGVVVTQTEGPAPGSVLPIGSTTISYEAVDQCGNLEICTFDVVVIETPLVPVSYTHLTLPTILLV